MERHTIRGSGGKFPLAVQVSLADLWGSKEIQFLLYVGVPSAGFTHTHPVKECCAAACCAINFTGGFFRSLRIIYCWPTFHKTQAQWASRWVWEATRYSSWRKFGPRQDLSNCQCAVFPYQNQRRRHVTGRSSVRKNQILARSSEQTCKYAREQPSVAHFSSVRKWWDLQIPVP